jgi:hypothetical protein
MLTLIKVLPSKPDVYIVGKASASIKTLKTIAALELDKVFVDCL